MKRIILLVIMIASLSFGSQAQNVNIPDVNFKAYLVGEASINTNSDTEIQVSEANAYTGAIFCNNLGITDVTGIEEFIALTALTLANDAIGTLDLSSNVSLTTITSTNDQLTSLNVSSNLALTELNVNNNNLSTLDVSNLSNLITLRCEFNQLTTLNLSGTISLDFLKCSSNNLAGLDLSSNSNMTYLECTNNVLSSLDISTCTSLTTFYASDNSISSLDASNNSNLVEFEVYNTGLSNLNLANGSNPNILYFDAMANPNLTCIQVDDAVWSTSNWTNIDVTSSFSENCGVGINESNSTMVNIYPNPTSDQINITIEDQIETIMIFDLSGSLVQEENTSSFSVKNLPNGIYMINIQTSNDILRSRFMKE